MNGMAYARASAAAAGIRGVHPAPRVARAPDRPDQSSVAMGTPMNTSCIEHWRVRDHAGKFSRADETLPSYEFIDGLASDGGCLTASASAKRRKVSGGGGQTGDSNALLYM